MAGNARSPPENSTGPSLSNLSLNDSPRQSLGLPRPPTGDRTGSVSKIPRPQREGYGFRPKSGQTTPAEPESSQGPFSPVLNPVKTASRPRNDEEEDVDEDEDLKYGYHQPDRISVGDLRQGVKDELSRQGGKGSSSLVVQGPGIADADGLGWPGQSHLIKSVQQTPELIRL